MAGYSPVIPGQSLTFAADGPIRPRDPVEVSGPGRVRRATGAAPVIGIAGNDAISVGTQVTVHLAGPVHRGPAQGATAVGDLVLPSFQAGQQIRTGGPPQGLPGQVIGVALTAAFAPGQPVEWLATPSGGGGGGGGGGTAIPCPVCAAAVEPGDIADHLAWHQALRMELDLLTNAGADLARDLAVHRDPILGADHDGRYALPGHDHDHRYAWSVYRGVAEEDIPANFPVEIGTVSIPSPDPEIPGHTAPVRNARPGTARFVGVTRETAAAGDVVRVHSAGTIEVSRATGGDIEPGTLIALGGGFAIRAAAPADPVAGIALALIPENEDGRWLMTAPHGHPAAAGLPPHDHDDRYTPAVFAGVAEEALDVPAGGAGLLVEIGDATAAVGDRWTAPVRAARPASARFCGYITASAADGDTVTVHAPAEVIIGEVEGNPCQPGDYLTTGPGVGVTAAVAGPDDPVMGIALTGSAPGEAARWLAVSPHRHPADAPAPLACGVCSALVAPAALAAHEGYDRGQDAALAALTIGLADHDHDAAYAPLAHAADAGAHPEIDARFTRAAHTTSADHDGRNDNRYAPLAHADAPDAHPELDQRYSGILHGHGPAGDHDHDGVYAPEVHLHQGGDVTGVSRCPICDGGVLTPDLNDHVNRWHPTISLTDHLHTGVYTPAAHATDAAPHAGHATTQALTDHNALAAAHANLNHRTDPGQHAGQFTPASHDANTAAHGNHFGAAGAVHAGHAALATQPYGELTLTGLTASARVQESHAVRVTGHLQVAEVTAATADQAIGVAATTADPGAAITIRPSGPVLTAWQAPGVTAGQRLVYGGPNPADVRPATPEEITSGYPLAGISIGTYAGAVRCRFVAISANPAGHAHAGGTVADHNTTAGAHGNLAHYATANAHPNLDHRTGGDHDARYDGRYSLAAHVHPGAAVWAPPVTGGTLQPGDPVRPVANGSATRDTDPLSDLFVGISTGTYAAGQTAQISVVGPILIGPGPGAIQGGTLLALAGGAIGNAVRPATAAEIAAGQAIGVALWRSGTGDVQWVARHQTSVPPAPDRSVWVTRSTGAIAAGSAVQVNASGDVFLAPAYSDQFVGYTENATTGAGQTVTVRLAGPLMGGLSGAGITGGSVVVQHGTAGQTVRGATAGEIADGRQAGVALTGAIGAGIAVSWVARTRTSPPTDHTHPTQNYDTWSATAAVTLTIFSIVKLNAAGQLILTVASDQDAIGYVPAQVNSGNAGTVHLFGKLVHAFSFGALNAGSRLRIATGAPSVPADRPHVDLVTGTDANDEWSRKRMIGIALRGTTGSGQDVPFVARW